MRGTRLALGALLAGVCLAGWMTAAAERAAAGASATTAAGARATAAAEAHSPDPEPAAVGRQPPARADLPGRIAFVSERDGNREIYLLTPATGELRRLTHDAQADYPVGPGGTSAGLLAVRASDDEAEGHVEQLELVTTSGVKLLGKPSKRVRSPAWIGGGLVFEADYEGFSDLYWLRGSAGDEAATERLTDAPEGSFEPAVEPGGNAIAFVSSRGGDAEIYRLELADRSLLRLTWSRGEDVQPSYSPDGRTIAFVSSRTGTPTVYLMDGRGGHPRPLLAPAPDALGQLAPVWSADGSKVAFVEQRPGRAGLRVVRLADGALLASTDGDWLDQMPAFSPDGRYLVFTSGRDGDGELYVMSSAGGPARRLTRSAGADWLPRWL